MNMKEKYFSAAFGRRMQRAIGFLGAGLLCVLLVTAAAGCRSGDSDTAGQSLPGGKPGTDPGGGTGDGTGGGSTGPTYDDTFVIRIPQDWTDAVTAINAGGSGKSYEIQIDEDVALVSSNGPTFNAGNLNVIISGAKTVSLTGKGYLIHATDTQHITLDDVILAGVRDNNTSLAYADSGTLEMKGDAKITGNTTTTAGGGVTIQNGGTLIMGDSASVTGNKASGTAIGDGGRTVGAGGVLLNDGTVEMGGNARIAGNEATGASQNSGKDGGGAGVMNGTFTMRGEAAISGNTSYDDGGGVAVVRDGIFVMKEKSKVYGNYSYNKGITGYNDSGPGGGGIATGHNAIVKMMDEASIYANTSGGWGGGVSIDSGELQIGGGVIYGYEASDGKDHTVDLNRTGDTCNISRSGQGATAWARFSNGKIYRGVFDAEGNFTAHADIMGAFQTLESTIRVTP